MIEMIAVKVINNLAAGAVPMKGFIGLSLSKNTVTPPSFDRHNYARQCPCPLRGCMVRRFQ